MILDCQNGNSKKGVLGKTWAGRKTTTTTTTTAHVNHEYMQDNLQISKTVIIKQREAAYYTLPANCTSFFSTFII